MCISGGSQYTHAMSSVWNEASFEMHLNQESILYDMKKNRNGLRLGQEAQEGGDIYAYLQLIHVVWQKPIQYCKAVIFQLKKKLA